jgi:large subunit ribosomal protein L9
MELILKQTVDNLGQEGDIVRVKPGYGRNYLIPQQIAVPANKANLARLELERAAIDSRRERLNLETESLTKKLAGTVITIAQRVGEEERLFGSVSAADIAEKLAETGIEVDKKKILLTEPIKNIGETIVAIKTGFQMTAEITVQVVPLEEA